MESTGTEYPQLTLFAEDTLASRSVTPATATAPTTHGTSGHDSSTPFAYFDPDSHCWRTCQGTLVSDLDRYSQTWPRSGTTHNGTAYQRQPSAPRTSATEYSLSLHRKPLEWTPTATAIQMAPSMQLRNPGLRLWPTPTAHLAKEGGHPSEGRLNTPTLTWQALWPTPTFGKMAGGSAAVNNIKEKHQAGEITDDEMRAMQAGNGGKLNPMWVEWLMGFPTGWTDLED